ncbi:MAG: hypothetical protein AAGF26_05350 [Cyanobacteria bacterium P01_G01_bin.49]
MNKYTKFPQRLIWLLIKASRQSSTSDKGYVLMLVIGLALALNALLLAYAVISKVERVTAGASSDTNSGFYGAEAALNIRAEELRQTFENFNRPSGASPSSIAACLDSNSSNDGSGSFACSTPSLFAAASDYKGGNIASTYVVERNGGQPTEGVVPRGEAFQNLNMQEYGYSVYSVAKKENAPPSEVTALLQLDVKSRLIPMFQFAAFYAGDLEILPGPVMNLSGPIHTNGDLYLGANKENGLNIDGQVTLSGDLYNKRKNNDATYDDGRVRIIDAAGTSFLNLLFGGTGSTSPTRAKMDPIRVATEWGTQVQMGLESISLPAPSLLNTSGDYYNKADLRIQYKPVATSGSAPNLTTVPFEVTAINRDTNTTTNLTQGELRSLRQPILVDSALATITNADFKVCTPVATPTLTSILTSAQTQQLPDLLYVAMVSQTTPIAYSSLSTKALSHADFSGVRTSLLSLINSKFALSLSSLPSGITNLNPNEIAALDGRCFVSAPIQDIGRDNSSHQSTYRFYNDREGKDVRLLQMNFQGLAIWNKVGRYVQFNSSGTVINNNSSDGFSADQRLFVTRAADGNAPAGSFQRLGLGATDTSEGGFVIHATIDGSTYSNASTNQSRYGFAITQGKQIMGLAKTTNVLDPTGVTFATDQAVYVQGDYNSINKQPAGILADSLNVLSNACLNADKAINKHSGEDCNIDGSKVDGTTATINSAFLGGTDVTNSELTPNYSGGFENYPRFSEDWSGDLNYRGSFVSLGIPLHVKGNWKGQKYGAPGRNWDYDTDFNNAENLPPLTPRFVYLRQESFVRNFQQ